ncbi:MAG TPA: histidine kinase [Candidatus Limnocylindrales bacterium]|nr:histidine kinase [Candidatus Limnocylindrales bacterium]
MVEGAKEAAPPAAAPVPGGPVDLARTTADEAAGLDKELAEIGMLIGQARGEAERHEARRGQAEEHARAAGDADAHAALVTATRRAVMMQSQVEVLEGKQRALTRYRDRLRELTTTLASLDLGQSGGSKGDGPQGAATDLTSASGSGVVQPDAQEALRREIARQMHDGPAQSLTNITLQAQIVQRLVGRDDARAQAELTQLVAMVQQTLDATKTFIFDVRPMVLDDLGLVPTLRRAVRERAQRSKVAVDLEVSGVDRRLSAELESASFRIVDEAVVGFLTTEPAGIQVHLDWREDAVEAMVRAVRSDAGAATEAAGTAASGPAAPEGEVPAALADMIRDQRAENAAREKEAAAARAKAMALPDATWRAIQARARSAGIQVTLSEAGRRLDLRTGAGA